MADPGYTRNSDKQTISLVLSIFKGENFVVKEGGCRAFLRAKCSDLQPEVALESGIVRLSPATSEPEFNSQLAWSLSRKQLKELRSNRSVIRISCIEIDEKNGIEKEVGYLVLHIKDAVSFPRPEKDKHKVDVDPSKAKTYPVLGTKKSWQSLQPKLQMILHLEELYSEETHSKPKGNPISSHQHEQALINRFQNMRVEDEPETDEVPLVNAAKLSETKMQQKDFQTGRFTWTVHENDGYFQLGDAANHDDLYILNTTVISASYLHKLWDGKSPRKQTQGEYFWQIRYTAYGCEIASEPFLLSTEDMSRRTFIGDKATARIRASGGLFYEYLQETSMEFQVIRYQVGRNNELTNEEVMGFCYVTLHDLGVSGNNEVKLCMDVVSEWGTSKAVSPDEKPEVRAMFTLEVVPNYFSIHDAEDIATGSNRVASTDQHRSEIIDSNLNRAFINGHEQPNLDHPTDKPQETRKSAVPAREDLYREDEDVPDSAADINIEDISNTSNVRRLLQFEDGIHESLNNDESLGTSSNPSPPRKWNIEPKQNGFPAPPQTQRQRGYSSGSDDSDLGSDKESIAKLHMPKLGRYKVMIELKKFWLKSSRLLEDKFLLRYVHQPIGIQEPIICWAQPSSTELKNPRQQFVPSCNEFAKTIQIQKYSESLINEPLTIEFCKLYEEGEQRCFATAMVPFGRIFSAMEHDGGRIISDQVDVLKCNNNAKIGSLSYEIKLQHVQDAPVSKPKQSAFFPAYSPKDQQTQQKLSSKNELECVEQIEKVTKEMREWTRTREDDYKRQKEEKETAYLRILSEEAAKRDAERETAMSKKLGKLEKKEVELNRQKRKVDEKTEELSKLEAELKEKLRELALQQDNIEHHADLNRRKLVENHKIEIDTLKREARGYIDENEKLKSKILVLEKKLETKEAEIDKLIDLKREQPDSRLKERVSSMEQENKMLRNQLKECNTRKEQYKKQMIAVCQKVNRLQAERDQELLDVNENLRLQILATKEHKELKKERKTVHEISQTLKALQMETVQTSLPRDGKGDAPDPDTHLSKVRRSKGSSSSTKDAEILRLQAERNRLLSTGAYTQFDLVIKELEKKMIALSQD